MPRQQRAFGHGDQWLAVLRIVLSPAEVLDGQRAVPDPVEAVGGVGEEVGRRHCPPVGLVSLRQADALEGFPGVSAMRRRDGELPVPVGDEDLVAQVLAHPEDFPDVRLALVVAGKLDRHLRVEHQQVSPLAGPVRDQAERLLKVPES